MFSKPRLEGRALEHALAGDGGSSVRMYDKPKEKWVTVTTDVAKEARRYMKERAEELVEDWTQRDLFVCRADLPVTLCQDDMETHGKQISVDILMWSRARGEHALIEVKWGRQDFKGVRERARKFLPKLKAWLSGF